MKKEGDEKEVFGLIPQQGVQIPYHPLYMVGRGVHPLINNSLNATGKIKRKAKQGQFILSRQVAEIRLHMWWVNKKKPMGTYFKQKGF